MENLNDLVNNRRLDTTRRNLYKNAKPLSPAANASVFLNALREDWERRMMEAARNGFHHVDILESYRSFSPQEDRNFRNYLEHYIENEYRKFGVRLAIVAPKYHHQDCEVVTISIRW